MPLHDLTDDLIDHLIDLLGKGRPAYEADFRRMGITSGTPPEPVTLKIVKGERTVVGKFPVIRVSPATAGAQTEWLATGVRKDRYSFFIDADIKLTKKEFKDQFAIGIATSVRNWLLEFDNLAQPITGTTANYFNSWAQDITLGSKGDNTVRTARFLWWADVTNPYYSSGGLAIGTDV